MDLDRVTCVYETEKLSMQAQGDPDALIEDHFPCTEATIIFESNQEIVQQSHPAL